MFCVHNTTYHMPWPCYFIRYSRCAYTLCTPTGGKCKLTEGCSFRKKQD